MHPDPDPDRIPLPWEIDLEQARAAYRQDGDAGLMRLLDQIEVERMLMRIERG